MAVLTAMHGYSVLEVICQKKRSRSDNDWTSALTLAICVFCHCSMADILNVTLKEERIKLLLKQTSILQSYHAKVGIDKPWQTEHLCQSALSY